MNYSIQQAIYYPVPAVGNYNDYPMIFITGSVSSGMPGNGDNIALPVSWQLVEAAFALAGTPGVQAALSYPMFRIRFGVPPYPDGIVPPDSTNYESDSFLFPEQPNGSNPYVTNAEAANCGTWSM